MTTYVPDEKGAILAIAGKINHLHILCTKQFINRDTGEMSILAVNISSVKDGIDYDKTCILHAGEHPYITHDSYVRYKDAVAMRISRILSLIDSGDITVLGNVSEDVFQRVLVGFEKSPQTKTKIKKLLRTLHRLKK